MRSCSRSASQPIRREPDTSLRRDALVLRQPRVGRVAAAVEAGVAAAVGLKFDRMDWCCFRQPQAGYVRARQTVLEE